jgi:hypothetical protein
MTDMRVIMERLWTALESISHDFDYPPDPESLLELQTALTQMGLVVIDVCDLPTDGIIAGALGQLG